ncbi:heavy metal translocating P-type ATPase [Staphylococcus argensis]|uniref:P-type Cu(+) transporter n=1 Tax=Staphylococcus argensis TaxID=1607738 RepID=A0A2K4FCQ3_9STAP|nr:heavy metal translocating P-type ATPase [Staphylococcus argensis]MCY6991654.1 heavy metal translocating P-type ATPase [Staphylococcus argensis]POA09046.1 copper-translocating P-type ATPase [Staphylococcus argensis]
MAGRTETLTLGIEGMSCAACSNRIEKNLNKLEDVEANVNLSTEQATITYPKREYTLNDFVQTIEKTGYYVITDSTELAVSGMTCAACSSRIKKVLNKMPGVAEANVNLTTEKARVDYVPAQYDVRDLIARIQQLGYDAELESDEQSTESDRKQRELRHKAIKLVVSAIITLPLLLTMLTHLFGVELPHLLMNPYFQLVLASLVQFGIGWQFYTGAYKSLRSGSANMDVLVALGTSAAYFYSLYETIVWILHPQTTPHLYYETSAVLITLILLGKYLEARAKSQTTSALTQLLNLQAKEARLIDNGEERMVPVDQLQVGQTLKVKPGESVPVDGVVLSGETTVDESMLTGESMPIHKSTDDEVVGGTMNQNGTFTMRTTHVGKDTALASIVKTVEAAQGSKAPIQRLADKISGYFVPIVVSIAVLTFLFWITLVNFGDVEAALIAGISVLVIACPCALGLATPTSIMVGTGKAAESGILFKGGEFVEQAHDINTLVLDKTGTLTHGKPEVTSYTGDSETLQLIASLEQQSEHPLATAIVDDAKASGVSLMNPTEFKAIPGRGIQGRVDDHSIHVGNRQLLQEQGVEVAQSDLADVEASESQAQTTMLIAVDGTYRGYIAVADPIKSSARSAIEQLNVMGVEVMMLTGDNSKVAQAIAQEAGIDDVIAEVKPEDKANQIQALQSQGKKVAMVGDGINDAPALVQADIGIAIGTGTEVAIEAADITIMGDDLHLLPQAVRASRSTIRNIRQNLFWALGYNVAGIPIAACGLLAPWVAGLAMALSSVSVVTNALRLKRMKL